MADLWYILNFHSHRTDIQFLYILYRDRGGKGMEKTFTIELPAEPNLLIGKVKDVAARYGAAFEGDSTFGKFYVKGVSGTYNIHGNILRLTITKKPRLMPWKVVESRIIGFFHGGLKNAGSEGTTNI